MLSDASLPTVLVVEAAYRRRVSPLLDLVAGGFTGAATALAVADLTVLL